MKNVKNVSAKKENVINLDAKKEALKKKFQNSLGTESLTIGSNNSIYKYSGIYEDNKTNQKKLRSSHRRFLDTKYKQIILSGKNNKDLFNHLEQLAIHYKDNYILNDFKINSFTTSNNVDTIKKRTLLLEALKDYIELSK